MEINWTYIILLGVGFVVGMATAFLAGLRGKIEYLAVSRSGGFRLHTNSIGVVMNLMGKCNDIDMAAKKSIRKGTPRFTLLNSCDYNRSTDVMLVNEIAKSTLISSICENHHTRELDSEGADSFIANTVLAGES